MNDVGPRLLQRVDLAITEMNTVGQCDVRSGQTETVEIRDVSQTSFTFNHLAFSCVFRSVRMDHHATVTREARHALQQLASAAHGKSRRKAIANSALRLTMPRVE